MGFSKTKPVNYDVETLEDLKEASSEKHIPKYNFCGPGTFYKLRKQGKYERMMKEAGKKPKGTAPYGKPRNQLDSACEKHDLAYMDKNKTKESIREADIKLKEDAMKAYKNLSGFDKLSAWGVSKAMGGKIVMDKITGKASFADIPKARMGGIIRNSVVY